MHRKIISLISVLFFLSATAACAQTLNDWERGVFEEVANTWHDLLYEKPNGWFPSLEEMEEIYAQVAYEYNISASQVKDIDYKGLDDDSRIKDIDYDIVDDLYEKLDNMSGGGSYEEAERIHAEVAYEYGISITRLHEIEYMMDVGGWWWF